jgi:hypothetical protein
MYIGTGKNLCNTEHHSISSAYALYLVDLIYDSQPRDSYPYKFLRSSRVFPDRCLCSTVNRPGPVTSMPSEVSIHILSSHLMEYGLYS